MSIKLAKLNQHQNDEDALLCDQYYQWKNNMDKKQVGAKFFILFKDFDKHLRDISSGALKLYLYYGFHAKNETGVSWHSVETIREYFNVSEKSINNWNNELIERGLIKRLSKGKSLNKTTYLLPFSMNYIKVKNIEMFNSPDFNSVYGNMFKAFHLFQWRQNDGESNSFETPYHTCVIVYEKEVLNGNNHYTAFEFDLNDLFKDTCVSELNISDDIYTFTSTINSQSIGLNISIPITGVAINAKYNLKKRKIIYELIQELIDTSTNLDFYDSVELVDANHLDK
ncbi:helix-turn-helix domain-containing protein [uncultured Clostridium sp.]|uniref:helix-turn-helix domain-containing protein n=1 Tax=uncultured Clostridium sp. TaxID=59620 RepID=UPI002590352F|nr:helix-turn-helix domain-containing protein [uncultured Clostridium sp.]